MTVLTNQRRQQLRADWGRAVSFRREAFPLTKAQLDAAIAAADDWVEANAVSFNNALPAAAKTNLNAAQKAELLNMVALARFGG